MKSLEVILHAYEDWLWLYAYFILRIVAMNDFWHEFEWFEQLRIDPIIQYPIKKGLSAIDFGFTANAAL